MTADDLRRELEASRRDMKGDYAAVRRELHRELDFGTKAKQSIRSHPASWLGAAAFLGYLLSPRRKRVKIVQQPALSGTKQQMVQATKEAQEPVKKLTLISIIVTVARMVFPLVRPALTQFAIQQAGTLAGRFRK